MITATATDNSRRDMNEIQTNVNGNHQLGLFTQSEAFSNALNFLHTIPRYDRRKENSTPQSDVADNVRVYNTDYCDNEYEISITGASTKRLNPKTGKTVSYVTWPGNREERVETAILKIATSGGIKAINAGSFNGYGCYFSIYQIRDITGMNAGDIKQAIEIMNKSVLEIKNLGTSTESWSAPFLPVKYVSETIGSRNDKCYVLFHPAVMSAIDNLKYRPYLYEVADNHKKGLTKYFHKRLIIKFNYANSSNFYNTSLRRLMNDYGKVPRSEIITADQLKNLTRDIRISLKELVDCDIVLPNFLLTPVYDGENNMIDRTIVVRATEAFIKQQRQSNHLVKTIAEKAITHTQGNQAIT